MIAFPKIEEPSTEETVRSMILRFLPSGIVQLSVMSDSGEIEIYEGLPQPGGELAVGIVDDGGLLVARNQKMNVLLKEV